jgi:hypothetical protein
MTDASTPTLIATEPARGPIRAFVARNRDALWLEVIGGVVLALVVSLLVFALDQVTTDQRDAKAEALSNSIFVRQAVMGDSAVLPFSSLNLRGAQLSGLPLAGADFSDADLTDAEMKRTDLTGANLNETDLTNVDLTGSTIVNAGLSEAVLRNTELSGVDFTGADVTEADFTDAYYVEGEAPIGLSVVDELRVIDDADD